MTGHPRRLAGTIAGNPRRLVALSTLQFTLFPIPIITLFWTNQVGLSLGDILYLQAVFGLAVVLLELPSGYVADRVGYRKSLLVGAVLWVAGWLVYTRAASFLGVMLAEVVLGAASAFISGADRALMWVSLDAEGRRATYTRWDGRVRAAAQIAESGSSAIGGWLYSMAPRLPFWLQVPVAAIGFVTVASLAETPRQDGAPTRSHLARALHVVRTTLWHHPRLPAAMALSVALGLSTFVMVWLIQPIAQARGVAPAWFGPLWAGAHAWLAAVSMSSGRVVATLGARRTLIACCALVPIGYAGLALGATAWSLAFYLCFMTIRGLQAPILTGVMQEDAPSEDRASVLSLNALLFRLAFVLVGPPVGLLIDRVGLVPALGALAVVFTAATLGARHAFDRAHRRATAVP